MHNNQYLKSKVDQIRNFNLLLNLAFLPECIESKRKKKKKVTEEKIEWLIDLCLHASMGLALPGQHSNIKSKRICK